MKNKYVVKGIGAGLLLVVLTVGSAWGYMSDKPKNGPHNRQEGCSMERPMGRPGFFPDEMLKLDENQEAQAKTLRLEMMKETTPLKNELRVLKAQLHSQSVGDNAEEKAVFKLMEQISAKKLDIDKKQFQYQRKFRSILTDDQKILFDADGGMKERPGMGKEFEGRHGCGKGMKGCRYEDPSQMPMPNNEGKMPEKENK